MTYPEIKLVDAPTSSATVLFDFNDVTATPKREVHADDFTIGVPELVGDVDAVDPLYGERVVSFTCAMTGTKPQVAAAQSALARRLLASGQSWLWVRMTATSRLLFFRTYRPQPGDLSFELVQTVQAGKAERWELEVDLPCEPFAYGERVTQSTQTISNDPTVSAGSNPMRIVLPSIVGDAPTRLRLALSPSAATGFNRYMLVNQASATLRTAVGRGIGTADGLTVGTDAATTGTVNASLFVGGSYREVTFATNATLVTRLSGAFPSVGPGRYRIMLRASMNGTYQIQASSYRDGPLRAIGGSSVTWINLGDFEMPPGRPSASTDLGPDVAPPFSLRIARTSGSSMLLDYLLLVPLQAADTAGCEVLTVADSYTYNSAQTMTWDGDQELAWMKTTATGMLYFPTGTPQELSGTFPIGRPGSQHVMTLFRNASVTAEGEDASPASSMSVTVSYFPRFLYVGDS